MVVFELMLSHQCPSLCGPLRIDLAVVAPPPEDLSKYWRFQFQASLSWAKSLWQKTRQPLCPKSQSLELQAHFQRASSVLESLDPKPLQAPNAKEVGLSTVR